MTRYHAFLSKFYFTTKEFKKSIAFMTSIEKKLKSMFILIVNKT